MFRLKGKLYILFLTNANRNTVIFIGGMIFYSAYNIGFEGKSGIIRIISEEEKLRWKYKVILIVDEINQINKLTFTTVNNCLK